MSLNNFHPPAGATKPKRRVGRGIGSGMGKQATRGGKGQTARRQIHPNFEGGQSPIQRRLPVKKGFTQHQPQGVRDRQPRRPSEHLRGRRGGDAGDADRQRHHREGEGRREGAGFGELEKKLTVTAHKFSKSAQAAIEAKGGTVTVLPTKKELAARPQRLRRLSEPPGRAGAVDDSPLRPGLPSGFGGAGDFGRKSGRQGPFLAPRRDVQARVGGPGPEGADPLRARDVRGVHARDAHPGADPRLRFSEEIYKKLEKIPYFQYLDAFGGGALRRVSILALGLQPYITASIIIQVLTTAFPQWKKELQEGGEYARKTQNKRTRMLALALCFAQGLATLQQMRVGDPERRLVGQGVMVVIFWTAGAMFMLWLGEQISEKGIGNGTSLMIFAGIVLSLAEPVRARSGTYYPGRRRSARSA